MTCKLCDDGSGKSLYPYYGVAPHTHDLKKTGSIIGSTEILPKDEWPANFAEDSETPGLGIYTHCLNCEGKE